MITEYEKLLLDSLDDLESRVKKGTEYDLNMAAAIARKLLIDGIPLIDAVNREYRKKILFKTIKRRQDKIGKQIEFEGIKFENVVTVMFAKPVKDEDAENIEYLKRDEFIKYKLIWFADTWFTVHDIIELCAYIYGGVHTPPGKLEKPNEIKLDIANKIVKYADGVHCAVNGMKDISHITIEALHELVQEIKSKHGIK